MPTLDEHNATKLTEFETYYTETLNGVNCNVCGYELYDMYPGRSYPNSPDETPSVCRNVSCSNKDTRVWRLLSTP